MTLGLDKEHKNGYRRHFKMLKGSLQNFVVVKSDQCKEEKKEWLEPATFQESGNIMKQTSLQPRLMPYVLITGFIQPKSKICRTTRLMTW
jgi:hypothetical protein